MTSTRVTHNAVCAFHRALCPSDSVTGAYRLLLQECEQALFSDHAPAWLHHSDPRTEGYLLLPGEAAALPLRNGRAVSCLINQAHPRTGR
jgi:hypothetical protein